MGIELRDNKGLICGFRINPQSGALAVELTEIDAREPPEGLLWLHFNFNDARSLDWIGRCAWLVPEGRDTLLSTDRSIRFEVSNDHVAGVLSDIFAENTGTTRSLHTWIIQDTEKGMEIRWITPDKSFFNLCDDAGNTVLYGN